MSKLIVKSVPGLTDDEYNQCLKTNLGAGGLMKGYTKALRTRSKRHSKCFMIMDSNGVLLSWALVFRWDVDEYGAFFDMWNAHFFTRYDQRRKGYGRRIHKAILKKFDKDEIQVFAHDTASRGFYREIGLDRDY